jgi:hypothetical protein
VTIVTKFLDQWGSGTGPGTWCVTCQKFLQGKDQIVHAFLDRRPCSKDDKHGMVSSFPVTWRFAVKSAFYMQMQLTPTVQQEKGHTTFFFGNIRLHRFNHEAPMKCDAFAYGNSMLNKA